jgi:hypothetical protein
MAYVLFLSSRMKGVIIGMMNGMTTLKVEEHRHHR